jgi:hypothetical protein
VLSVQQSDVERILRDVLSARGVHATVVRTERTNAGWRMTLKDGGARTFSVDLPAGPAAAIRAALEHWADDI